MEYLIEGGTKTELNDREEHLMKGKKKSEDKNGDTRLQRRN